MKPYQLLAVLACAVALSPAHASDFTGVYARIDRVVLEPNADAPERIQVWGVFVVCKPDRPNEFEAPARGYLYLKLNENANATRNEWKDLKAIAGTGEVVGFGIRGQRPPKSSSRRVWRRS
jgi:hypothetical protein